MSRRQKVTAALLTLAAGGLAVAASWQRWINPFVDSGRELVVPWRVEHGDRLYSDITYYYGPLGPWVNALALRVFGDRWLVLEVVCALLAAAIFALLFQLTRRAGSVFSATVATALAAALCMGAPRGGAFIFPYSSSNLFALAGCLLALVAASGPPANRNRALAVLGLAVGLASRIEIGATAMAALVLAGLWSHPRRERALESLGIAAAGGVAAAAAYAVAFAGVSPADLLTDGPFIHFSMPAEWRSLYLHVSGLERPGQAAGMLAISLLLVVPILAAAAFLGLPRGVGRSGEGEGQGTLRDARRQVTLGGRRRRVTLRPGRRYLFPLLGILLLAAYLASPLCVAARNLPPVVAILPLLAAAAALLLLRRPLAGPRRARFLLFFFSAGLAARVLLGLNLGPSMSPYCALPLPGLLATAAVLAFDVLAPRLPAPAVFRRRLAAVLAVLGALFLYRLDRLDHQPGLVRLETRAGALRLPAAQEAAVADALDYVARHARPGQTLTAFPESGFFNFVTSLPSPLRQDQFFPGVLYGAREAGAARQVDDAGPRYILLCNRPTPEYGPASFGSDFAVQLWNEVEKRYVLAGSYGGAGSSAPVGAKPFFIRIYERNGPAEPVQIARNNPKP